MFHLCQNQTSADDCIWPVITLLQQSPKVCFGRFWERQLTRDAPDLDMSNPPRARFSYEV